MAACRGGRGGSASWLCGTSQSVGVDLSPTSVITQLANSTFPSASVSCLITTTSSPSPAGTSTPPGSSAPSVPVWQPSSSVRWQYRPISCHRKTTVTISWRIPSTSDVRPPGERAGCWETTIHLSLWIRFFPTFLTIDIHGALLGHTGHGIFPTFGHV